MSRIIEDVFPGFGLHYVFPTEAIYDAAERVGLPRDMAELFVAQKIQATISLRPPNQLTRERRQVLDRPPRQAWPKVRSKRPFAP